MKKDRTTGLLFASSVLLLVLCVLTAVLAWRVQGLAEAVADTEYIRVMEECERCREKEASNWEAAVQKFHAQLDRCRGQQDHMAEVAESRLERVGQDTRELECCWDLVETMRGKGEREVLEERCEETSMKWAVR